MLLLDLAILGKHTLDYHAIKQITLPPFIYIILYIYYIYTLLSFSNSL